MLCCGKDRTFTVDGVSSAPSSSVRKVRYGRWSPARQVTVMNTAEARTSYRRSEEWNLEIREGDVGALALWHSSVGRMPCNMGSSEMSV